MLHACMTSKLRDVSKEVCPSLSWVLEQVAMGIAQVTKLGPVQQQL